MKTLALVLALLAAPTQDRADVPIEVEPTDPGAAKVVILAGSFSKGGGEHEYFAGSALLFNLLKQTPGVAPFKENDGFIYKLKFVEGLKGITPLLRTTPPKATLKDAEDIVSWAFQRPDGGRSFVFTGCHLQSSWGLEGMRRFVINGILWSAGLEVPAGGAPVELDPAELKRHLDPVPAKK
jgi:hypothetical protein